MRKSVVITASALAVCALSVTAFARDYTISHLPYTDMPSDRATAIAISTLTASGVLAGNPDGTIRAGSELNRAEFMKIVMRLMPVNDWSPYDRSCFPDVKAGTWYAPYVCRAKQLGIINGNAVEGVPQSEWMFKPNSAVQYEEAVKVLAGMYALTLDTQGGTWYDPYIRAALKNGVAIDGLRPGDRLKRGEMARLVTAFIAFNEGDLQKLRDTEAGRSSAFSSSSSTMSSTSSSVSSSSHKSSLSSSSKSWSGSYDVNIDSQIRAQFLPLGSSGVILGSVTLFSNNEPLDVTVLRITLANSTSALDSLFVYDQDKHYLGRAVLDPGVNGNKDYVVRMPIGMLTLPKRQNVTVYARAIVKNHDQGGESNQTVRIASITIQGNGEWTNGDYQQTYTDSFSTFLTARAHITSVVNTGGVNGNFTTGSNQLIGSFLFHGQGDSQGMSNLRVNALTFQIDAPSGVTLSNVYLKRQGGDEISNCTVGSGLVTCPNIPATIGSVDNLTSILVYGDLASSNVTNPTFRLTLNNPGTATTAGSVTWTDGDATYTWVAGDTPIVRGTQFN